MMSRLDFNPRMTLGDIIREIREDAYEDGVNGAGHPASIEEDVNDIRQLILTQNWYYHDPDELGEDAFKPLGEDEVSEL